MTTNLPHPPTGSPAGPEAPAPQKAALAHPEADTLILPPTDVAVQLDDRVRLLSAVLAATRHPQRAQEKRPHGTHPHARATRRHVQALAEHPAVHGLNTLLDQGAPLDALFTLALGLRLPEFTFAQLPRWAPPSWDVHIRSFYDQANLAGWWQEETEPWSRSLIETRRMFEGVQLKGLFTPFVGPVEEGFIFIPNISYPTDQELSLRVGRAFVAIVPPPLAWGDSAPWPFDREFAHVYRAAIVAYGRLLMSSYLRQHADRITEAASTPLPLNDQMKALYPTWAEQFTAYFLAGIVAMYLEERVNEQEARGYVLMERKTRGMAALPAVVSVLRRYRSEHAAGRFGELADFLPLFPKQLRIANRIVSM
jgi:hypothetical protein